jgi:hypothetical protein
MQNVPAALDSVEVRSASGQNQRVQDTITIILFLLPALVLFLIFVVYPIFQSIYYSMFNWKGFGPATDYVGLGNFVKILNDKIFMLALRNGGLIILFSLSMPCARRFCGKKFMTGWTTPRLRFPVGSSSACAWRVFWPLNRKSSCWTSPPPRWTRSPRRVSSSC